MKSGLTINYNPSFGKVIPIKKIVLNGDTSDVNYQQLDSFELENKDNIDTSCDTNLSKKVIAALNKILLKTDEAEKNTYKNALNNMVRRSLAQVDDDYKIPTRPVDYSHKNMVVNCHANYKNYLLTGKEASEYSAVCRKMGGSNVLANEFGAKKIVISRAKEDYANWINDNIKDSALRLKNEYGGRQGLVIYADKVKVPKKDKGKKGFNTEINIKGIDFEPV